MIPVTVALLIGLFGVGLAKGIGVRWARWSFAAPLLVGVFLIAGIHPATLPAPSTLTPTFATTVEVVP